MVFEKAATWTRLNRRDDEAKKKSCCKSLKQLGSLLLETLQPRKEEDNFLQRMLLNRAWLFHCIRSVMSCLQFSIGESLYLKADDCSLPDIKCPDYNAELMEPYKKAI